MKHIRLWTLCIIGMSSIQITIVHTLVDEVLCHAAPAQTYEQRLDQVRLYIRNQMLPAALTELEQLSRTQQGQADVRVFAALAKVNFKLHEVTLALKHLRTARDLSRNPAEQAQLTSLYEEWLSEFGLVRFEPASSVSQGSFELVRKRKLINQERQAVLDHVSQQFRNGITLPISVYLPYGSYLINEAPFKIARDGTVPVVSVLLKPTQMDPPKIEEPFPWLYVGLGGVAIIAAGIGSYFILSDPPSAEPTVDINISSSGLSR